MGVNIATAKYLQATLGKLYAMGPAKIKMGLARTEGLLAAFGNPERSLSAIHITGTTGKGSTAAYLESILRAGGYSTGLYTSPHLFVVNERIRKNGENITDQELAELIQEISQVGEGLADKATFHEFLTVLALLYFSRQKVDIAIIEACMGGRWDTTNVITPLVSIITNVGLDHTQWLGDTKEAIAREKAGIIKPGIPFITAERDLGLREYFQHVCEERGSEMYHIDDHLRVTSLGSTLTQQTFRVERAHGSSHELTIPLLGHHQVDNAAIALLATDLLQQRGFGITRNALSKGLSTTQWEGRLQVLSKEPFIVVDGGNNADSLRVLRQFLTEHMSSPAVLVLGKKQEKELSSLREITALFSHIIVTEGVFQPMSAKTLSQEIRKTEPATTVIEVITNPAQATQRGLELVGESGSLVITGSLYMIPEALTYLKEKLPARAPETFRTAL